MTPVDHESHRADKTASVTTVKGGTHPAGATVPATPADVAVLAAVALTVVGMMLVVAGVVASGFFLPGVVLIGIGLIGYAVAGVLHMRGRAV